MLTMQIEIIIIQWYKPFQFATFSFESYAGRLIIVNTDTSNLYAN